MQAALRGPIVGAVIHQLAQTDEESESVINFSATGDTSLVAAIAGQTVRMFRIFLVCSAATNLTFKDGVGGTALTGAMSMSASGAFTLDTSGRPWFTTSSGNALVLNQSGTAQISGRIYFVQS